MTTTQYQKLQRLLRELFRTDQADLDFGIYRVINQKRDEINKFLDENLLPQVEEAFGEYQAQDTKTLQIQLKEAIKQANELGVDPEEAPKVIEIKEQIANFGVDVTELENQVYAALYNFFRRYYDKGDFISQRRYKEGVYAIPYEGEEVKLHWANHDQYYIKTSEHLRNYTFKLKSGQLAHVKLVSADTEKDNRKEADDKKRRFILTEDPLVVKDGQLTIRFEYREDEKKRKQDKLNKEAVDAIFAMREGMDDPVIKETLTELSQLAPTESDKKRTVLEKHLTDYTRRNTQDYFIHKDLGKFLRQELDFFIKNEIMRLDDIDSETAPKVEQYLSKIKVIRKIAHKIITFLAQIEDFQKKMWLKKKFVVESQYCVTLDRVPEELYPVIVANDAQRDEWVKLFVIDEIKGDLVTESYSKPLTVEFLKSNPFLVLDTKFYDEEFKYKLLESFDNLDDELDGLLIHSENFQALNLLQEKYRERVKCIYIDPPYNTSASEILYKNTFKHSSWLAFMENRIRKAKQFLSDNSVLIIAIDDTEMIPLSAMSDHLYSEFDRNVVVINHHPAGAGLEGTNISSTHEYALFFTPKGKKILKGELKEEESSTRGFVRTGTAESNLRIGRPNSFYAILVDPETNLVIGAESPPRGDDYPEQYSTTGEGSVRLYPIGTDGTERVWRRSYESFFTELDAGNMICKSLKTIYYQVDESGKRKPIMSNWTDTKYNAGVQGSNVLTSLFGEPNLFSYPKSIFTVEDCVGYCTYNDPSALIVDFFAGSGTTSHAVINLNRKDGFNRRYLLVEMGQYFDYVTKPRTMKVIYSEDWKGGKPLSRKGTSNAFKYLKVESYEDSLNNLELKRSDTQDQAIFEPGPFREEYLLTYLLDIENQDSLLNLESFETPFDYKLEISTDTVGETTTSKVDLIETFNYLIGLHVEHLSRIQGVVVVEGTTRNGEKTLVIWRDLHEMDNEKLDQFFETLDIRTRDFEYDLIYVNGDNNLPNLRADGENWKVRLIEEDFLRLMFDEEQ